MQHHFDVDFANKYGVPAAIVLDHLQGWIYKNRANKKNRHDNRWWTYNSIQALTKIYSYWSPKQIRKVYDDLATQGIILKNTFSTKKNDRTLWYAFVDETAFLADYDICPKRQMDLPEKANGFAQKGKCIRTITNEPSKEPIPAKQISQNPFSFARELNEIIPARSNSDWKAYANIAKVIIQNIQSGKCTESSFEEVKKIAREAAAAKVEKKIALFFKLLSDRLKYKKQRYPDSQAIGSVLMKMGLTG